MDFWLIVLILTVVALICLGIGYVIGFNEAVCTAYLDSEKE